MVIFLLSAVPLLGLLYLFSFYGRSLQSREVLRPGAAGIIIMTAAMLVLYIIQQNVGFPFTQRGIFLREWSYGYALPYVLAGMGLMLLRGKILTYDERGVDERLYGQLCAYWFGAGAITALFYTLYSFGSYDIYDLFLYPILLFLFCCISAYLTASYFTREGWTRYIFAISGLIAAALPALVAFFFYINLHLTAYLLFGAMFLIGGLYVYLLDIKKLLPRP
mgnify:CR=1 FL=1